MALDEIRITAVEGYHRVPHGGVETGGILFGTQQKNVVRIKAWRPIVCEYAKGPSFLLTAKEEEALAATLKAWRGEPELAHLEPVGWYRAHTRSEILLSQTDLDFYKRFFPQAWQVALIVRPGGFAPTRAGFFFREADGKIREQSSYREFTLTPLVVVPPPAEPTPPIAEAPPPPPPAEPAAQAPPAEPPPSAPAPPAIWAPSPVAPPSTPATRWKWYALSLSVMVLAFLGFWLWKPSRGLKLTATDTRGQLRISWDAGAQPIAKAKSGAIQIDDHGTRTQLTLTAADLRSGALFYERLSGDVAVSLAVAAADGGSVVESTRFLRPGESAAAPAPPLRQPQPQPAETAQAQPLSSMPATAPAPAAIQPTGAEPTAIRHIVPFRPPAETPRRASAEMPNIAPPTLENSSAIPQSSLPGVLGSEPRPPAPSPAPAAAPGVQQRPAQTSAAPPIVAAPVGGRIIWTGRLAKNGRVTIQRNQASSGAVSGALPGVAAHAIAIPGDLTAYGLTLFTGDQKYSNPITERASPENGWNNTTFTLDPKRASGVRVVEQPSAQNGYKLVLESSSPRISVVMIEWRAAQ